MTRNPTLQPAAALIFAVLLSLAGCQQCDEILANRWRQSDVASHTPLLSGGPSGPVTQKQTADVQMALGRSLEKQGQADEAMKIYEEVLRNDATRADACHRLAVLHDKKADFAASAKLYQTALKKNPKNAELLCDLGYSYYLQGKWKESEANLKKAIEVRRDLLRAHNNLGLVYAHTGRSDKALAEFARAGCSEAQSRTNLAYAMLMDKHWFEAQKEFSLALATDPQSKAAQAGLETLAVLSQRDQSGQVQLAIQASGQRPGDATVRQDGGMLQR